MNRINTVIICIIIVISGCSRTTDDWIKDLNSDKSKTRLSAAYKLALYGNDPETVHKLIDLLDSDNDRLVFIVTQILGDIADSTSVKPLGLLINHSNPDIRERSIQSLGLINYRSAGPYIMKALEDSSASVRSIAAKMLGFINYTPAAKQIVEMLHDPSSNVRVEVVHALYTFREEPEAGITASNFKETVHDDSERVRYVTVQALGYVYPDSALACEFLISSLKDKSKHVRAEAIKSLNKIRCTKAIPHFKKMHDLSTYEEQIAISEAIKNMTGEDFPAFRAKLNK